MLTCIITVSAGPSTSVWQCWFVPAVLSSIPAMIASPSADITSRDVKTSLLSKRGLPFTIQRLKEKREKGREREGKEVKLFTIF